MARPGWWIILSLGVLSWLVSFIVHYPWSRLPSLWGLGYSDIVYGVFYDRFTDASHWYNLNAYARLLSGDPLCPLPYIDYRFEYPPLVALLWVVSVCTASLSTTGATGLERVEAMSRIHYVVQALLLLPAWLGLLRGLQHLAGTRRAMLLAILPSSLLYLVYNWDVIAAALTVWSLVYAVGGRIARASLLLGLAASAKILPGAAIIVLAVAVGLRSTIPWFTVGLLPFPLAYVAAPRGVADMVSQHAGWYCENCIYLPLTGDPFSPVNNILAYTIVPVVLALCASAYRRTVSAEAYLATLMTVTTFNYVFTPQMHLLVSPLALAALPRSLLPLLGAADAANAAIIPLFFNDDAVRSLLGLNKAFNPWAMDSPTQWAAMTRNILYTVILGHTLYTRLRNNLARSPG